MSAAKCRSCCLLAHWCHWLCSWYMRLMAVVLPVDWLLLVQVCTQHVHLEAPSWVSRHTVCSVTPACLSAADGMSLKPPVYARFSCNAGECKVCECFLRGSCQVCSDFATDHASTAKQPSDRQHMQHTPALNSAQPASATDGPVLLTPACRRVGEPPVRHYSFRMHAVNWRIPHMYSRGSGQLPWH